MNCQTQRFTMTLGSSNQMDMTVWICPLEPRDQERVLALLHTEWDAGDFDWHAAMGGQYAATLTIRIAVAVVQGCDAGTATVVHAVQEPEVAVISSVLTTPSFRRKGIAAALTEQTTAMAFQSGCQAVCLGSTARGANVYERMGYTWYNGGVMRRLAAGASNFDSEYFDPGQKTRIRDAQWGDLAGVACLLVRPYEWFAADYQRSIFSGRFVHQKRCVSNFPYIYEDVVRRQGMCCVLTGCSEHRILGLASVTPGPTDVQQHTGVLDFVTHEAFYAQGPSLVSETLRRAQQAGIRHVIAYVVDLDQSKADILDQLGFDQIGVLPGQVMIAKAHHGVYLLHRRLG